MTRAYLFNQDAGHLTQWFDLYPSAGTVPPAELNVQPIQRTWRCW
jgi:hypothetical protein